MDNTHPGSAGMTIASTSQQAVAVAGTPSKPQEKAGRCGGHRVSGGFYPISSRREAAPGRITTAGATPEGNGEL